MSTPQGPDRYGADRDPEQAGPPTWGTPPPGGWGGPDTAAGQPDDQWDPDGGGGYVGRRRADEGTGPIGTPWGDQPEPGYDPGPATGYDPGPGGQPEPWDGDGATAWGTDPPPGGQFAPGDEPWAPREAVRTPRRGPGGLGTGALAGIGAGVLVVAALLVALFWVPGWAVTSTLDKTALQNGVTQILTQSYKLQVGAVECPDDVTVETGTEFSCQALVDGEQVTVPGRVTSDEGDYQVSRV